MMFRRFGCAAIAATLLVTLVLPAFAAEKLVVARGSAKGFGFDPIDIGIEQKFYELNGLDVEMVQLDGSAKVHQAMVAGAIDLAAGAGTDIAFLVKGAPEQAVGAIALGPQQFGFVISADPTIKTAADLKGRRIGISTVGSLTEWFVRKFLQKQGWKPDDVTMITVGADTMPQTAALETHQIDAVVTGSALGWQLEAQNRGRLLFPASDIVSDFLMNVIFASNKLVAERPDAVRAFLKAWYETVDFMRKNRAETIRMARAIDGYSEAVEARQYDVVMPSLSSDGRFPAAGVAMVQHSFVDLGILPNEPDMKPYMTERFLPRR